MSESKPSTSVDTIPSEAPIHDNDAAEVVTVLTQYNEWKKEHQTREKWQDVCVAWGDALILHVFPNLNESIPYSTYTAAFKQVLNALDNRRYFNMLLAVSQEEVKINFEKQFSKTIEGTKLVDRKKKGITYRSGKVVGLVFHSLCDICQVTEGYLGFILYSSMAMYHGDFYSLPQSKNSDDRGNRFRFFPVVDIEDTFSENGLSSDDEWNIFVDLQLMIIDAEGRRMKIYLPDPK